jgi:DNA-binding Lrp family transcriptional regulator
MWTPNKIASFLGVSRPTVIKAIKELFPDKIIKKGIKTLITDEEFTKIVLEIKHKGLLNINDKPVKNDKLDSEPVKNYRLPEKIYRLEDQYLTKIGKVDEQLAKLERMTENMVVLAKELSYMLNKAFSYSEKLLLKENNNLPNPRKEIWEAVNDFKHVNGLDGASRDVLLDLAEKYQKETGTVIKTNNDYEAVIRNLILKNKVNDFVRWVRSRL